MLFAQYIVVCSFLAGTVLNKRPLLTILAAGCISLHQSLFLGPCVTSTINLLTSDTSATTLSGSGLHIVRTYIQFYNTRVLFDVYLLPITYIKYIIQHVILCTRYAQYTSRSLLIQQEFGCHNVIPLESPLARSTQHGLYNPIWSLEVLAHRIGCYLGLLPYHQTVMYASIPFNSPLTMPPL